MQPLNHMNTSLSAKSLLKSKTLNNYTLQTRERTKEGFLAKKLETFFTLYLIFEVKKKSAARFTILVSLMFLASFYFFVCVLPIIRFWIINSIESWHTHTTRLCVCPCPCVCPFLVSCHYYYFLLYLLLYFLFHPTSDIVYNAHKLGTSRRNPLRSDIYLFIRMRKMCTR